MDNGQSTPKIPFEPAFVNVPIYLAVHERDADNMGASQADVLLAALTAYKAKIKKSTDSRDKEMTLILIDEMRDTILDVLYTRLSESAEILHAIKHNMPCHE